MARDVLITPISGSLVFSGSTEPLSSSFIGDNSGSVTLYLEKTGNQSFGIEGSGSTVVKIDGSLGRLFTVTDILSGSIFSANTIAGLPVIEAFSDSGLDQKVIRLGIPDVFATEYGSQELLMTGFGLDPNTISKTVIERFKQGI